MGSQGYNCIFCSDLNTKSSLVLKFVVMPRIPSGVEALVRLCQWSDKPMVGQDKILGGMGYLGKPCQYGDILQPHHAI